MSNKKTSAGLQGIFAGLIIPITFAISYVIYAYVFGDGSHFEGGDNTKEAISGDMFGIIYKGGIIVPILLTCFLTLVTFVFERLLTITLSRGTGSMDGFLREVKVKLSKQDIDGAIVLCNKQKGSIGNVVLQGLNKYKEVWNNPELDKDTKLSAITQEIEEATTLELPMLERNLVIISTVASIATLVGLFGTVLGMIRAFAALGSSGASDSSALANGISEALINTALGIGTSALAIIFYNFFTNKIDGITYRIEEAGFSIAQTFASSYSNKDASNK